MAQIRHIAIQTQDEEATKRFYVENFGLKEVRKLDSPRTSGYFLTDGHINLAILRFKNDVVAGAERGTGWSGIHHIGFQVESLEEIASHHAGCTGDERFFLRHMAFSVERFSPRGLFVGVPSQPVSEMSKLTLSGPA